MGKMFLVVVDAHSKWLHVEIVPAATSQNTIHKLRSMFATHGLLEMVVSDNGTPFTSSDFQEFMQRNGIRHVTSAPYHPASNGLAERAVQTFKEAMKKSSGEVETRVARFLFHYRSTPHSSTGVSPAELLMGRRLRTHLALLHPDVAAKVRNSQQRQKAGHDKHAREREFVLNDNVFVRNFGSGSVWLPGTIVGVQGLLSFQIKLEDGRIVRRHIDHVRARVCDSTVLDQELSDDPLPIPDNSASPESAAIPQPQSIIPRRSNRVRRPPDRFQ